MIERIKLTEGIISSMRIAVRKRAYQVGGTEYMTFRAYKVRDPHIWWYDHQAWELSIFCEHNAQGEYCLEFSPEKERDPKWWFCFLRNGRHSNNFLHLKHITYFDELQLIVRALTGMELFVNEYEAKKYLGMELFVNEYEAKKYLDGITSVDGDGVSGE
jgi:hypothetical protein